MRAMPASQVVRERGISVRLRRLRCVLQSRLFLSGILALGSTVALPPSALSQAAPSQTTPAQTAPTTHHRPHKKPAAAPDPVPAPPPPPTVAPSLFEQPPVPATVTASANELTVKADNSSLTQILHQVSSATGMRLNGLGGDERVFGSFGPGAPRDVLTTLLNGTSYNIMMVGDLPSGAPRELVLTSRAASGAPPQPTANANQTHNGDEDNAEESATTDDSDETPPPMQYTPPSIAPATPPNPQAPQRMIPQMRMQNPPQ
jgi:hypothetical protein